jgi:hypothetical protein
MWQRRDVSLSGPRAAEFAARRHGRAPRGHVVGCVALPKEGTTFHMLRAIDNVAAMPGESCCEDRDASHGQVLVRLCRVGPLVLT